MQSIAESDIFCYNILLLSSDYGVSKQCGLIFNLKYPNYAKLHRTTGNPHHPEIYTRNITVEKSQNTFLVLDFKPTPPPFNFLTSHFRLVECLNYPEGFPLAHTISIQHSSPPAQVRTHSHTQFGGERLCADRTFSHFNFTVSGFCHQYGNKKWMKMMKIKPWLLGSGDWEREQNEAWHHVVLSSSLHIYTSSFCILFFFSWLLIFILSCFKKKRRDLFSNKVFIGNEEGLCGNWGPSEGLPKKCLTE